MRKSQEGLYGVRKDNYPNLSEELRKFNYYYPDAGHSIVAVPECLLERAEKSGDLEMYEVPFPVKYVLEKGYRLYKGIVVCDAPYNWNYGLEIPSGYDEF